MSAYYKKVNHDEYMKRRVQVTEDLKQFSNHLKEYKDAKGLDSEIESMIIHIEDPVPTLRGNYIFVNSLSKEFNWREDHFEDCRTLFLENGHKVYIRKSREGILQQSNLYIIGKTEIQKKKIALEELRKEVLGCTQSKVPSPKLVLEKK